MSLVCWEMVPSIFTFSWEYTAYRKENTSSEKEIHLNTTLKELPLRTHEYFLLVSPEIPCYLPTSFTLISHLTRTPSLNRDWCISLNCKGILLSTCIFSSWYSRSVLSVLSMSVWSRASCRPWVRRNMWLFWRSICCCSFPCCGNTSTQIFKFGNLI